MFTSERSSYDKGVNIFSAEGRIHQIEYANKAAKLFSSCVGLKCKEGVVIAVEKRARQDLQLAFSLQNLNQIDYHILCGVSGHIADSTTLVNHARSESQMHRFVYNEPISVKAITQSVSDLALNFGEGDMTTKRKPISRPYGVVLLIAGVDDDGPNLYQVEPSGTMVGYQARIIGPADERQSFLAEKYDENMSLAETEKLA